MSVFGLLAAVGSFIKIRYLYDKAVIDNPAFRLHYRFTSAFFFASCILITAFDLFGKPIDCTSKNAIRIEVVNTYCWITSTFTFYNESIGRTTKIGPNIHPGVGPSMKGNGERYHSYYQWVPFVLFLQGVLFYLPHWIWKVYEDHRIKTMTEGFRGFQLKSADDAGRRQRRSELYDYFNGMVRCHSELMYVHVVCEILNFVNAIGNIYFIDKFLGGYFLAYGSRVIEFSGMDQEDRHDPMIETFPRMTKCTWRQFGPSGTVEEQDALCMLPINIIHEKIYIFIWFWLIILSVISAVALVYRFMALAFPRVRVFVFNRQTTSLTSSNKVVIPRLPVGDFFILSLIGKNLDGVLFSELMKDLELNLKNTPLKRSFSFRRRPSAYGWKSDLNILEESKPSNDSQHVAAYTVHENEVKFPSID